MTTAKLKDGYKTLNIHFCDDSESMIARNILMIHLVFSDGFNPANPTDLQYIWDVWYSLQWNEATKERFIKDVQQVMAGHWAASKIVILNPKDVGQLKKICRFWLDTLSSSMAVEDQVAILENRYKSYYMYLELCIQ
jgi:hypothetical protein